MSFPILAALALASCGGASPQVGAQLVATRHSAETGCPAAQVAVTQVNRSTFRAVGCGHAAFYVCRGSRFQDGCVRDSELVAAEATSPSAPAGPELTREDGQPLDPAVTQRVLDALALQRATVSACLPSGVRKSLVLTVAADGQLTNVVVYGASDTAMQCIAAALAGRRLPLTGASETLVWEVHDPPPPPVDPNTAAATARASLRALLASHAADVIACVGHAPVGVHATWDAAGHLTVGLQGDLAGQGEETCVRDALGTATIDSGGAGGDAVELVRAP